MCQRSEPCSTMSLTPPLCAMLRDELLQKRYLRHLDRLIGLARQEIARNRHHPQLLELGNFYESFFSDARALFSDDLVRDAVMAFRELQDAGGIDGELAVGRPPAAHGVVVLEREPERVPLLVAARALGTGPVLLHPLPQRTTVHPVLVLAQPRPAGTLSRRARAVALRP